MAALIESTNGDIFGIARAAKAGEPRGNEPFLSMNGLRQDCYIHTAEFYLGKPVMSGRILGCSGGGICVWTSLHEGLNIPFRRRTEIADSGKGSINELGGFGMVAIDHFDYTMKYHNYEPFVLYAKDDTKYYVFDISNTGLTAHKISISSPDDLKTYAGDFILLADWLRRPTPDIMFRPGALYELRTKLDPDFVINYGASLQPDQIHAYIRPNSNDNKNKWYVEVSDDDTFDVINYVSNQRIDVNEKKIYTDVTLPPGTNPNPNTILWYLAHDCFQMYPKRPAGFNGLRTFLKPHDTPEHGTVSKSIRQLEGYIYQTEFITAREYATTNREVDAHQRLRCCAQFHQNGEDTNLRYIGNSKTNCFGFARTYPYQKWIPKPSILGFINDDGEEVLFGSLSGEEHIEFNIPLFSNYGIQCRYFEIKNGLNEKHGKWCSLSMCDIGGHLCSLERIKDITDAHNIILYFRYVGDFGIGPCCFFEFSWWPYRDVYTSSEIGTFKYSENAKMFRMRFAFPDSFKSFGRRITLKEMNGYDVISNLTHMTIANGKLSGFFSVPVSKLPTLPSNRFSSILEIYSESVQAQPTLIKADLEGDLNVQTIPFGNDITPLGLNFDCDTNYQAVTFTLPNNDKYIGGMICPSDSMNNRYHSIPFMSDKTKIIIPIPYRFKAENLQCQLVFKTQGVTKVNHYTFYMKADWIDSFAPQAIWFIDNSFTALKMRCNLDAPYTTNRSLSATITKKKLLYDDAEIVYFDNAVDDIIKIEGMVPEPQAVSFRNALLQKKAFFRAPNGFYGYVGITNVDLISTPGSGYMNGVDDFDMYTTVSISMVRISDYGGTWIA